MTVTVTGSGQVSTLSKVEIKPSFTGQTQTLGQIVSVKVKNGDYVKAGDVIAILDGKNALQTYTQAKASLVSAQASYDRTIKGLTDEELLSLNNSMENQEISLENTRQNILIKLKNTYTSVSNSVYLNTDSLFENPMTVNARLSTDGIQFQNLTLKDQVNLERVKIGEILSKWKSDLSTLSTSSDLSAAIQTSISRLNTIRNYFDDMTTLYNSYVLINTDSTTGASLANTGKNSGSSARSSADSLISDLTSTLQSYNSAVISLRQSKESYALKVAPVSENDLASAESQLATAKSNLQTAAEAYASRIITASFDGQVGGLDAVVGQSVSSNDSIGTLITSEKVVNLSLNEVDAAKINENDKVVLTFDSLSNVSVKGHVSYLDPLGTVNNGVVSYSVQIALDEQNTQIKTGMTASAVITTTSHSDTLIIPTSAITTKSGKKTVLVAKSGLNTNEQLPDVNQNSTSSIQRKTSSTTNVTSTTNKKSKTVMANVTDVEVSVVEIAVGLSNDTNTEVLSGLEEGDYIVTKTINSVVSTTKSSAASATTNSRGIMGGMGGGPGAAGGF